jgi:hypothetical protein
MKEIYAIWKKALLLNPKEAKDDLNIRVFNRKIIDCISSNPLYNNLLQSVGQREKMKRQTDAHSVMAIVEEFWQTNRTGWIEQGHSVEPRVALATRKTNGRASGSRSSTLVCPVCDKPGHKKSDCRFEGGGNPTKCSYCDKYGHDEKYCRKKQWDGGSRQGAGGGGASGSRVVTMSDSDECSYPGCKDGRKHKTADCPTRARDLLTKHNQKRKRGDAQKKAKADRAKADAADVSGSTTLVKKKKKKKPKSGGGDAGD